MRKFVLIIALISLYSCGTQKATVAEIASAKPITLYKTTGDFINNNPMQLNASAIIAYKSDQHITLKSIIDPVTGMRIKNATSAWAIKYNGKNYFNLGYSDDLNNWNSYAKFDIEGKICAIFIDENSPNVLKASSTYYGGGLAEVLIKESTKWGKNWKDKNGNKKKILFIDTNKLKVVNGRRNTGSLGNYLTREQLKELIIKHRINFNINNIKEISFEKVVEIIKLINSK